MWDVRHTYSFWSRDSNEEISSSRVEKGAPYVFVHYCEHEPTYDFREGTYWTEFETDSSEAASIGTGIMNSECKWRAVISLSEAEAEAVMHPGGLRFVKPRPVREYQSKAVIPNSLCTVTALTRP